MWSNLRPRKQAFFLFSTTRYAKVAELVDALVLGTSGAICESSSLSFRTIFSSRVNRLVDAKRVSSTAKNLYNPAPLIELRVYARVILCAKLLQSIVFSDILRCRKWTLAAFECGVDIEAACPELLRSIVYRFKTRGWVYVFEEITEVL